MFRISIDNHPFEVVEVDDTAVWGPSNIHEIQVGTGQRTSIIINTDQGVAGDAWYLRANVVTGEVCCAELNKTLSQTVLVRQALSRLVLPSCVMLMSMVNAHRTVPYLTPKHGELPYLPQCPG